MADLTIEDVEHYAGIARDRLNLRARFDRARERAERINDANRAEIERKEAAVRQLAMTAHLLIEDWRPPIEGLRDPNDPDLVRVLETAMRLVVDLGEMLQRAEGPDYTTMPAVAEELKLLDLHELEGETMTAAIQHGRDPSTAERIFAVVECLRRDDREGARECIDLPITRLDQHDRRNKRAARIAERLHAAPSAPVLDGLTAEERAELQALELSVAPAQIAAGLVNDIRRGRMSSTAISFLDTRVRMASEHERLDRIEQRLDRIEGLPSITRDRQQIATMEANRRTEVIERERKERERAKADDAVADAYPTNPVLAIHAVERCDVHGATLGFSTVRGAQYPRAGSIGSHRMVATHHELRRDWEARMADDPELAEAVADGDLIVEIVPLEQVVNGPLRRLLR